MFMETTNNDIVTYVTTCSECEASARAVFESHNEYFELDGDYYKDLLHEWMVQAGFISDTDSDAQTLRYSVGFCQGDGASFELRPRLDLAPTTEALEAERQIHTLRDDHALVYLAINCLADTWVTIDLLCSHYAHENTMGTDWSHELLNPDYYSYEDVVIGAGIYNGMRLQDLAKSVTQDMVEAFANDLLELCREKARELHGLMCDEVLYQSSEEAFKEWIANAGEDEFELCDVHAEERDAVAHYLQMKAQLDLTVQL